MPVPKPTKVHRIFHIKNLESILENGGQYSRTLMNEHEIDYHNISNGNIQNRRSVFEVPLEPFGDLHDYVPFYFTNRSPMLSACFIGTVPGYDEGQEPIIYLVSNIERLKALELDFVFTDGQGNKTGTSYYKNISDLINVDWEIIDSWSWGKDPERKRKKQAELLVHEFVPIEAFYEIVVINEDVKAIVEEILDRYNNQLPVYVRPKWYYD